jgi:hypothetical protein
VCTRIPAHELERAVIERLLEFLQSSEKILRAAARLGITVSRIDLLLQRARQKALGWKTRSLKEQECFLKAVIQRVVVHRESIEIRVNASALLQALSEEFANEFPSDQGVIDSRDARCIQNDVERRLGRLPQLVLYCRRLPQSVSWSSLGIMHSIRR